MRTRVCWWLEARAMPLGLGSGVVEVEGVMDIATFEALLMRQRRAPGRPERKSG